MAKAIVDPAELRRFANDLKRFNAELQSHMTGLMGRFNALGQTWRDQEQRKFAEEFEQTLRTLARFSRAADEQVPFLMRKADRIEEYLRQR
ncbi:MAG: WXG100 family type VII secretion target [Phycisphaeraceae bacterium]|nr:WXG100 family type VII secretion target [Phycisphaerales bacterium]MCA9305577.1 WXG100 family type VII secretion target [Phycisphaerales bacterium]MCB9842972.1 WXG100 family type VII secretion target [Phycisphaeraceae bacterium]